MTLRLYKYKLRRRPVGWESKDGWVWSKPGVEMSFSYGVLSEMPGQVDDLNAKIPIFECLRDHGVNLEDFYEYQGEPRTFDIWPKETRDKPLSKKMQDVVGVLLISKGRDDL